MEEQRNKRGTKRYGWFLFFLLFNWLVIAWVIWKVDPDTLKDYIIPGSYMPMLILLGGGIFWLLSLLFMSAKRAIWWTIGIITFLYLRIMELGTVMNGFLILGLLVSWEIYRHKSKKDEGV